MTEDAHQLMPDTLLPKMPPLYGTEDVKDPIVHVKYFTPWGRWTWYATEYDPDLRLCFGFVSGLEPELGYFSLTELEALRGPFGLRVERDLYFTPQTLSAVRPRGH